jgi:hypothetical protein
MFFAIANDLLAPSIRATKVGISSRAIAIVVWNNFENVEDESSGMKHHDKCS